MKGCWGELKIPPCAIATRQEEGMTTPELAERVPLAPHNLEAEEAVLGAVLLDPELIHTLATMLRPEDFFLEKHRWIWEAYLALHDRREAIDPVTVADELERQGRLQEVGGRGFLIGLAARVPTTVHALDYARLVERDAIRRRLLEAATQIARMAYEEPSGEVDELLDRAEAALFAVAQRRLIRDVQSIRDLLRAYYEHIEYLYEHRGEPLGIPTGFRDLDRLLGGLQRSDLVIVAARPGVGKTSLLLSFALNAAKRYRQRVAIFSLEMSAEQVVHRLVTQETGIEGQRLRLGELREDEWPRFVHAVSTLSELPIWIDDTPAISALQLRAKARRLYAEHGLDLLIVDYLQLMTADIRAENRVQEISYISRALKSLARELNIPVVAASQLSRAVEQRHDKRPILADLRESGCLAGDTLIPIADTGERVPIRELVGREPFTVWALNLETWRLERAWVSRVFPTGRKPIYRLTTRLGRAIRATANHRFLTPAGWKRLDELQPGMFIALPRQIPAPYPQTMSDEELALLGHLIGDGCALPRHAVPYTTREKELASRVADPDLSAYGGMTIFKQNVRRNRALRLARAVQSEKLARLAQSDVYWDSVASIEPEGIEDVFDMTVPGLHNFVANDVIVHNSIEQDSDVVIFIYRDEIYNQDTDRKNIAEIIVAKHRNGPIGTVELYFRPQQAQFVDLHKQEIRL
jgi:replicative DNA helicase